MFSIIGNTIKLTRGDSFAAEFWLKYKQTGEAYEPQAGDSILFAVKSKLNAARTEYIEEDPLIQKTISINDMTLRLAPEDTKELPFGSYFYDIEVTLADGTVDTVINNATFLLVPEVA